MPQKLTDCLNIAATPRFKALLNRAAFLERTTMSALCRRWIKDAYEEWKQTAPDRIHFDIFLSLQEVVMLQQRGYRIEVITEEGYPEQESPGTDPQPAVFVQGTLL